MKKIILLFLCFSPFCSFTQQEIQSAIVHDGRTRTFILYVPQSYTGEVPVPLIFNFHGYTSNAEEQMWYGDFRSIADTAGFLIVHPQGTVDNRNNTHFNVGWGTSSVDDVGFSSDLIDTLSNRYKIDPARIYSTGMSNGGFMSYHLACNLNDRIAAIASVTGSMSPLTFNTCDPVHPTPILQIHGTQDAVVNFDGEDFSKSIPDIMQYWVTYNNCTPDPVVSQLPDVNTSDNSRVEEIRYMEGDAGVESILYKVYGGGHSWPGASIGQVPANQDINASLEIWKFFTKYDINGLRTVTSIEELKRPLLTLSPNPTHTSLSVIWEEFTKPTSYEVLDMNGKTWRNGTFKSRQLTIDVTALPQGLYLFKLENWAYKIVKTE